MNPSAEQSLSLLRDSLAEAPIKEVSHFIRAYE
jgi:hypothetical protein